MRILITGASGFAGRHLVELCEREGAEVVGLGRGGPPAGGPAPGGGWLSADLRDAGATARALRDARPERVVHLAAQASVAESWRDPRGTIGANVDSTLNLLEAVAAGAPDARVLVAGSSEQYGPVAPERLPVTEHEPFRPQNPYAVSKCACDLLAGFFADASRVDAIRARPFNHAGPGQHERYAMSSFARQIAAAEAGGGAGTVVVTTGNTAPRRDFTDVRDVVRAYWLLLERAGPGAYNVCSGRSLSVADILAGLAARTPLEVEQRTDPALLRDNEVMEIRGSRDRATELTGWEPQVPIERTFEDVLDWWRAQLAGSAA
jgi:GDP-4-dehydro-6-deoxy-D-mannose reductase